nr:Bm14354 [Brugia malayi]
MDIIPSFALILYVFIIVLSKSAHCGSADSVKNSSIVGDQKSRIFRKRSLPDNG